jgi:hypothetical protein
MTKNNENISETICIIAPVTAVNKTVFTGFYSLISNSFKVAPNSSAKF